MTTEPAKQAYCVICEQTDTDVRALAHGAFGFLVGYHLRCRLRLMPGSTALHEIKRRGWP